MNVLANVQSRFVMALTMAGDYAGLSINNIAVGDKHPSFVVSLEHSTVSWSFLQRTRLEL